MTIPGDPRTIGQITEHYRIERELADRLRVSSKAERGKLYGEVYDELFQRVPHHRQLVKKEGDDDRIIAINRQLDLLRRFLSPQVTYVEIGAGDCRLAKSVASHVKQSYAIDVSAEISSGEVNPPNFDLIISDGTSIPVPDNSADVIFSNQLMEHLHPEDAREQLANLYSALGAGGVYICITPHRFSGPHDISRHFDDVATGLHLKEYTWNELRAMFLKAGFSRLAGMVRMPWGYVTIPVIIGMSLETLASPFAPSIRRRICQEQGLRAVLTRIILIGWK